MPPITFAATRRSRGFSHATAGPAASQRANPSPRPSRIPSRSPVAPPRRLQTLAAAVRMGIVMLDCRLECDLAIANLSGYSMKHELRARRQPGLRPSAELMIIPAASIRCHSRRKMGSATASPRVPLLPPRRRRPLDPPVEQCPRNRAKERRQLRRRCSQPCTLPSHRRGLTWTRNACFAGKAKAKARPSRGSTPRRVWGCATRAPETNRVLER